MWWHIALILPLGRQRGGVGRDLSLQSLPGLWSEFQDSQGYTEKPCLKNQNKQNQKKKKKKKRREKKERERKEGS
jgi:hypothetical protein